MPRECRKCGEIIPTRIKIDGKERNLQNRKFCLKCSSYKSGNTSPHDPIIRRAKIWKLYTQKEKDAVKLCNYYRALQIRDEMYMLLGNKCKICGYNKCKRSLSFHHRNPSDKLMNLGLNTLWAKNREVIKAEVEKCDLLCLNCHTEIEDSIARKTSIVKRVNEKYGTNF
jgi:predicted Zn-ribbon and HTH transcriptional regulator